MESIHEFLEADYSEAASAWFTEFAEAIYSLEQYPGRGAVAPENKKLRQLFFGKKPNIYRIIYKVDERNRIVRVVHLRHGARGLLAFDDVEG